MFDGFQDLIGKIWDAVRSNSDTSQYEYKLQKLLTSFVVSENSNVSAEQFPTQTIDNIRGIVTSTNSTKIIRLSLILILYKVYIEIKSDNTSNKILDILKRAVQISFKEEEVKSIFVLISSKYYDNPSHLARYLTFIQTLNQCQSYDPKFPKVQSINVNIEFNGVIKSISIFDKWGHDQIIKLAKDLFGIKGDVKIDSNCKIEKNKIIKITATSNDNFSNSPKIPIVCQYKNEKRIISTITGTSIETLISIINHSFSKIIKSPCRYYVHGNKTFDISTKSSVNELSLQRGDVIEITKLVHFDDNSNMYNLYKKLFEIADGDDKKSADIAKVLFKQLPVDPIWKAQLYEGQLLSDTFKDLPVSEQEFILEQIMSEESLRNNFYNYRGYDRVVDLYLRKGKLTDQIRSLLEGGNFVYYKLQDILFSLYKAKEFSLAKKLLKEARNGNDIAIHYLPDPEKMKIIMKNLNQNEQSKFISTFSDNDIEMAYFKEVCGDGGNDSVNYQLLESEIQKIVSGEDAKQFFEKITSKKNYPLLEKLCLAKINVALTHIDNFVLPLLTNSDEKAVECGKKIFSAIVDRLSDQNGIISVLQGISRFVSNSKEKLCRDNPKKEPEFFLEFPIDKIFDHISEKKLLNEKTYQSMIDILISYHEKYQVFDGNSLAIAKCLIEFPKQIIFPEDFQNEEEEEYAFYDSFDDDDDDEKKAQINLLDKAIISVAYCNEYMKELMTSIVAKIRRNDKIENYRKLHFVRNGLLDAILHNDNRNFIRQAEMVDDDNFQKIVDLYEMPISSEDDKKSVFKKCCELGIDSNLDKNVLPFILIKALSMKEKGDNNDDLVINVFQSVFNNIPVPTNHNNVSEADILCVNIFKPYINEWFESKSLENIVIKTAFLYNSIRDFHRKIVKKYSDQIVNYITETILADDTEYRENTARYYERFAKTIKLSIEIEPQNKQKYAPLLEKISEHITNKLHRKKWEPYFAIFK
ncbi:hypothetical protein TVAG_249590 [Trichomonas vaginalis G3]|uniref:Uncharacterized protein n=1 Tax=Trichomonas vaginalis (strain ATCC PRA-98 / G3) TaxID=412133 RepID=A2DCG2_TRIV3|nr:ubiquitinyl hydrolase protein [Trichomonas vaginalis G3]EAY21899.1 hypothetical protein TVAG_249590 [Trichomonas vaginalis G3]KAI5487625.1 ubiquitinyl hydrolase protein [Trichomonas vaginalis G3]|eukprot:XP_001582885.1 hypothetical protein [Trichomonas vaginalis G3]